MRTMWYTAEGLAIIVSAFGGVICLAAVAAQTPYMLTFSAGTMALFMLSGALMRDYWTRWN